MIEIELLNENNMILSKYESNAQNFLYPRPLLRPKYSRSCRSVLMECILWPIGPKLEFQTNTTLNEEVDNRSESDIDSSILGSVDS